jgi:hypothetical protein
MTTLVASCSNCAAWRLTTATGGHASTEGVGYCARGLFPPASEPRCESYTASHAFQQAIISTMLKEGGPMAMPVKLIGGRKSAKGFRKRA